MPFGRYEVEKPTPVPTFLQYVKTIGKGVEGKTRFQVDVIWLPGKFDNVTLQTHAFRYICSENHPLYQEIKEYCSDIVSRGAVPKLHIVITEASSGEIEVSEDNKNKCEWKPLGSNAFKASNL